MKIRAIDMCSPEGHEFIKATPSLWALLTKHVGFQDDGEGGWLELRNCRGRQCAGTTLAVPVTRKVAA